MPLYLCQMTLRRNSGEFSALILTKRFLSKKGSAEFLSLCLK